MSRHLRKTEGPITPRLRGVEAAREGVARADAAAGELPPTEKQQISREPEHPSFTRGRRCPRSFAPRMQRRGSFPEPPQTDRSSPHQPSVLAKARPRAGA